MGDLEGGGCQTLRGRVRLPGVRECDYEEICPC